MYSQWLRGTFASSTKYLRQSSWPYIAAAATTVELHYIRYLSFFNEIFQDLHVTTACCLYCRIFFRISRRFHFVEKKSKTVEVSSNSSLLHDSFFIIRAIVREAVLQHLEITFICCRINRHLIPLALFHFSRPLEKLEFVRCSNFLAKPGLIYHSSIFKFLSPGHVIPHHSNVEMDVHSRTANVIPIRLPRRTQAHPDSLYSPLKRTTDLSYSISEAHARQKHPYDATPTRSKEVTTKHVHREREIHQHCAAPRRCATPCRPRRLLVVLFRRRRRRVLQSYPTWNNRCETCVFFLTFALCKFLRKQTTFSTKTTTQRERRRRQRRYFNCISSILKCDR